jgi:hypothetical protein
VRAEIGREGARQQTGFDRAGDGVSIRTDGELPRADGPAAGDELRARFADLASLGNLNGLRCW